MSKTLVRDATNHPQLFVWYGAPDPGRLQTVIAESGWNLPADLVDLWLATGGGEIFETEILFPPVTPSWFEDVHTRTQSLQREGLPLSCVAFHEGLGVTAYDQRSREFVYFADGHFRARSPYRSLDEWYRQVLRREYAERYGLPADETNR